MLKQRLNLKASDTIQFDLWCFESEKQVHMLKWKNLWTGPVKGIIRRQ